MLRTEQALGIPKTTIHIARAAFPKGNRYITLRDELGTVFDDEMFAGLFPKVGQPAESPWRLALVTIIQHAEGLSDREAADAVRARIDIKYLLGLPLDDPGFHYSILSRFRDRLIDGKAEQLLLDAFVERCRQQGVIKERGKIRSDSTHILSSVRDLSRAELVGEAMRAALNAIARVEPEWLRDVVPDTWFKRYVHRFYDSDKDSRRSHKLGCDQIGTDGLELLEAIRTSPEMQHLWSLKALEVMRRCWVEQFYVEEDRVRFRRKGNLPQSTTRIQSPFETEAQYGQKGGDGWVGYKTHFTETCDDDWPSLVLAVTTTWPSTSDITQTPILQKAVLMKDVHPREHFVDYAFISADLVVSSQQAHDIQLIGPMKANTHWQQQEGNYDTDQFEIDWEHQTVTCPEGVRTSNWTHVNVKGRDCVRIQFPAKSCRTCRSRPKCVRSLSGAPRILQIRPREQFEVLKRYREARLTPDWQRAYRKRSGIESTFSQGVRSLGLRESRYRGRAKNHLQNIAVAVGLNIQRLHAWHKGHPNAKTRVTAFSALRHLLPA